MGVLQEINITETNYFGEMRVPMELRQGIHPELDIVLLDLPKGVT